MKRPACFVALSPVLTPALAVCGQSQLAPASTPVFRVEKALAQVEATVIDRHGRQGRASTAADCKVRPGGEPMPVAGATHLERRHPAGYSAGSCSKASAAICLHRSAATAGATGAGHRAASVKGVKGDSLK